MSHLAFVRAQGRKMSVISREVGCIQRGWWSDKGRRIKEISDHKYVNQTEAHSKNKSYSKTSLNNFNSVNKNTPDHKNAFKLNKF